ncbi:alpha-amylase family protein [Nonomuraea jiangxiensis]|uniref:Trehalose utilisation n=1 Tax=Nonomuraea jiangxiensis TaxID=633440 RepID=A0A1G9KK56_9ACTN|nr:alpha-amylase family protein [Nonomuraea jiangxiensis]SDL50111.1 Trehalose utilisation [Nonomuraea jiangxiensis]
MRTSDWPRTATRWTQLTLAEDDPAHLDVDFWTSVMRDSRSNAVCISAGGYIAYYPTRIPFHHRSTFLGDTDPFGALVERARGLGMHVMARVDPHAVHADAARAHPEWLARDAQGTPIEHWSYPDIWLTCAFTGYHREFITEVAREIVREYDVDAIFANRWEGYAGISHSEAAQRSFRDETGFELPERAGDGTGPAWPAYVAWRRRRLSELVAIWDAAVKDVRPHARFIPNLGAFAARDLEPELVRRVYPMFVVDKQGRSGIEAPWAAGRVAKRSRGLFPDRPVGLITSVGPEHHQHRWKDAVAPPEEVKTWIVDGFAQGAFPWFTKFNATISDPRWVPAIVEAFGLHARLEPVLAELPVSAEVALLDPDRVGRVRTGAAHTFPDEDGFYQALVEARIPFDLLADQALSAERLRPYKVLVLADAEQLSDAQCQVIREYVAAGGGLVAAHQSSLYDERGEPREGFGLADVLGVDLVESVRGPVKNNYIALTGDHPVNAGFDGARRIIGGTRLLRVAARAGTRVPLRFVPDFPDLPMEELYARERPDAPAAVIRQAADGGGRVVYFPFDLGAVYWEALQADHGRLIANAVRWALGGEPEVTVRGPGLADLAVRRDADAVAVALVNLTNPMAMRGAIRETIPLPAQTVTVALPPGVRGAKARLLVAEADAATEVRDGRVEVELTGVGLIEVVHLTWDRA